MSDKTDLTLRLESENAAREAGITLIAIGDDMFVTKPDACKISGWSLAYINKLVNSQDGIPAQVDGIQMKGLGWLIAFHSFNIFRATARRKVGLQTKRWLALEVFLSDVDALSLLVADDNPDATINAWLAIDANVTDAHKATKA